MIPRPRTPRVAAIAFVGCAVLGLVNCGGSSDTATPTTTPSSSATSASKGGTAKAIDVCSVLDAPKAAELSGHAITTAHPASNLQPQEYGCTYSNDDSSVQVEVTVFEHNAAFSYSTFSAGKNLTDVSGLGDKAFYDNEQTLYVLSGDALIQVNGVDGADKCAAMARPVPAAL